MLTARIEKIRQNYVNAKPQISCERAALWTESYKKSEGKPACIRSAQAFYDCCVGLGVHIFEGELIVGAIGEYRKCGILTPEFSWQWVDREMDHFATRPQDPYIMTDDQRRFVQKKSSFTGKASRWKKHSLRGCLLKRGTSVSTPASLTATQNGGRRWGRSCPTIRMCCSKKALAAS